MKHIWLLFVFLLLIHPPLRAQTDSAQHAPERVSFVIFPFDTLYCLPQLFIKESSEKIFLDEKHKLRRDEDYSINYSTGCIRLSEKIYSNAARDTNRHSFVVEFQRLTVLSKNEYSLRTVQWMKDSTKDSSVVLVPSLKQPMGDDIFGSGISKSGSIVRGFTIGNNQDMSLNSGFRLQLAGKLASDVDVVAALTDENTPIQPEGTTQTLREVDKVYIEIKHPEFDATIGDVSFEQKIGEGGEFGQIQRKILGAYGFTHQPIHSRVLSSVDGSIAVGTTRGKYTTNSFQGLDGVQGPYRLQGKNGERYILVIAGSERVYIDGVLMTRGELNDYTIDYGNGEITFTSRRLITNASRIVVDFEYSDQQYSRNLYNVSSRVSAFSNSLKLQAMVRSESDDPESPIDFTLSDSAKALLQASGDDKFAAAYSGISYAGIDTSTGFGAGSYMLVDTVIQGKTYSILVYAPGNVNATYSASFSPVEKVPIDSPGYYRTSVGQYKFAGVGQGNYMPYRFLPMPQAHQLVDVQTSLDVLKNFSISGEFAGSSFDGNRVSSLDPKKEGGAFRFVTRFNPQHVAIHNFDVGSFDLSFSKRRVQSNFLSSDRFNEVEYNRKWDILSDVQADEDLNEFALNYAPRQGYIGAFQYGELDRKETEHSRRYSAMVEVQDSILPHARYSIEDISARSPTLHTQSQWTRQNGTIEYQYLFLTPAFHIESEDRRVSSLENDSLMSGSFRFIDVSPRVGVKIAKEMSASAELQIRNEDSALAGGFQHAASALTQSYGAQLTSWNNLSASLDLSIRRNKFSDEFRERGNLNTDVVLTRFQSSYIHPKKAVESNLYYEFSNQRSARLERVFLRVPKGTGNYSYIGDTNNNGVADENEFQLVRFDGDYVATTIAGEQLYPVADVKTSLRVRLRCAQIFHPSSIGKILQPFSSETYVRIEEKSSDPIPSHIYLLNLKYFLREQSTLQGVQNILHDIFLFEGRRDFSLRFRLNEKWGFSQYVTANERTRYSEQSLRIESQLVKEIGNQTDIIHKRDALDADMNMLRERNITMNGIQSDFSYRPTRVLEVGFVLGLSRSENAVPEKKAVADINEQTLRMAYSFPFVGEIRGEVRREETVIAGASGQILPYELTDGKVQGKSYLWLASFEYRIGNNIQFTVQYNGRTDGGRTPIHTMRAEARAFF